MKHRITSLIILILPLYNYTTDSLTDSPNTEIISSEKMHSIKPEELKPEKKNGNIASQAIRKLERQVNEIAPEMLIKMLPFALVAKCFEEAPQITLAVLSTTLVFILSRNSYIKKGIKKIINNKKRSSQKKKNKLLHDY